MTQRARPVVGGSLGILGGTFDPVHIGHLAVAEEAREAIGLERVLFVPARIPPHKQGRPISAAADRVAMVELAVAHEPAFEVSALELERAGPSYTVDTLETLCEAAMSAGREPDLWLILSTEAFRDLHTWHDPQRILRLARLAVAPRDGYADANRALMASQFPGFEDRAVFLEAPRLRISATELRERAALGRSLRYLVPDAVAAYIGDHGLYTDPSWRID
ncbi:MAG: nicotinate-nucleotide adenylyltransferase [Chloroflexota bacterium]